MGVLLLGIVLGRNSANRNQNEAQVFATPVINNQTPVVLPTLTPQPTTTLVPVGKTWKVTEIKQNVIHQNGFWYDVATFQNVDRPDVLVQAMCMAPKWPSPALGTIYQLNDYDVLYPVTDNATNNLQRFLLLK